MLAINGVVSHSEIYLSFPFTLFREEKKALRSFLFFYHYVHSNSLPFANVIHNANVLLSLLLLLYCQSDLIMMCRRLCTLHTICVVHLLWVYLTLQQNHIVNMSAFLWCTFVGFKCVLNLKSQLFVKCIVLWIVLSKRYYAITRNFLRGFISIVVTTAILCHILCCFWHSVGQRANLKQPHTKTIASVWHSISKTRSQYKVYACVCACHRRDAQFIVSGINAHQRDKWEKYVISRPAFDLGVRFHQQN